MANTFPSAGDVGIGTTTPVAPLHIQSGSALLALFQGNPAGSERAYIQLTSSNSNYTWQISDQDASYGNTANGLAFVESTAGQTSAAVRVYFQQGGNVGVGLTNPSSARFAVANSGGTSVVQFQASGSAAGGLPALSLGYGAYYGAMPIYDAGYLQADSGSATAYPALLLNPLGGSVQVGRYQLQYEPADQYPSGLVTNRFFVTQFLSSGSTSGNAMAYYALNTVADYPSDSSAGTYAVIISGGVGGNNGSCSVRAIEAQTIRISAQNASAVTQGMYVGLHSAVSGSSGALPPQNVGVFINSAMEQRVMPGVRNDAAVWITGEDGWYYGILYDDGNNNSLFWVLSGGDMYAAQGNFAVDPDGNVSANGTIAAVDALASPPGLFHVDSGGNAYATSYNVVSSLAIKKDVSELTGSEAAALLDGLDPVKFRYKRRDDREHLGFILEDAPPALKPTGTGVSLFDLMAVLTRVAKDQREEIERQRLMNLELRAKLDQLKPRAGGADKAGPEQSGPAK